jgi:hypothetical protein
MSDSYVQVTSREQGKDGNGKQVVEAKSGGIPEKSHGIKPIIEPPAQGKRLPESTSKAEDRKGDQPPTPRIPRSSKERQ